MAPLAETMQAAPKNMSIYGKDVDSNLYHNWSI